jgi:hypothetical protein
VALGAVGLGLLAHGLANPDVKGLAGRLGRRAKNGKGSSEAGDLSGSAEISKGKPSPEL